MMVAMDADRRGRFDDGPLDARFWTGDLDARLPALFRIALASVLLYDLLSEIPIVTALYGAHGIWPRGLGRGVLRFVSDPMLLGVWAIGCAAMLSLALGFHARVSAVIVWAFEVSLHLRDDAICSGGDYLSQMCLFFFIWLDTGAAYSLDARWRGKARAFVAAAPWRAMQLQLGLLYLFTAIFKLRGDWLSGEGVYLSLQQLGMVRPLGGWLFAHPMLCMLSTWGVVGLELATGALILSPIRGRQTRLAAAVGSALVQVGIGSMMRVGIFTSVMLTTIILLVPEPTRAPPIEGQLPRRRRALVWLCAIVLATNAWAALKLPVPGPIQRVRVNLGLRQDLDLFGAGIKVAAWSAIGTRTDGTTVDVLEVAPGFRSAIGWSYSPFYKLTFADDTDFTAVAHWLCRTYAASTGTPLLSIALTAETHAPALPDAAIAPAHVALYSGRCGE
jgi:hypothetical protein